MDLFNVSISTELPKTKNVLLEYNKKTYNLGKLGVYLVRIINLPVDVQINTTCIDFVRMALSTFTKQPTESWLPSETPIDMSELSAYTAVLLSKDKKFQHAAVYIEDGIFLSKIGPSPVYLFCTFQHLRQLYDFDSIHPFQLVRRCEACHKDHGVLLLCKRCRQATYCNAQCQKKDWNIHKAECDRLQVKRQKFPEVPKLLTASSPDCQKILRAFLVEGSDAFAWITTVLNTCNSIVTPCTRLEELNALVAGSDDDLTDLCISNRAHKSAPFSLARLKDTAFQLILNLSQNRILGFEFHEPFEWAGSGAYPNTPPDHKFENRMYQAQLVLRNGSTEKTGHFTCTSDGYKFDWNRA